MSDRLPLASEADRRLRDDEARFTADAETYWRANLAGLDHETQAAFVWNLQEHATSQTGEILTHQHRAAKHQQELIAALAMLNRKDARIAELESYIARLESDLSAAVLSRREFPANPAGETANQG